LKNKSAELRNGSALADMRRKDMRAGAAEGLKSTDSRRKRTELSRIDGDQSVQGIKPDQSKRLSKANTKRAEKIRPARKSSRAIKADTRLKKQALSGERKSIKKRKLSKRGAKKMYGLKSSGKKLKKKRGRRKG
jgi:hypothetical protein